MNTHKIVRQSDFAAIEFEERTKQAFWKGGRDDAHSSRQSRRKHLAMLVVFSCSQLFCGAQSLTAQESALRDEARESLRKGVEFFRTKVAVEGTYLWQYSEDFSKREGEGKATVTQGWVQPPGTPAVGLAYVAAWEATSNRYYLEAIRETAYGLVRGQLLSGGWHYAIDFSAEGRKKAAYRDGGKKTARNTTTFDDDTTQAALRFLMRADQALGFKDAKIRESVEYALNSVLRAQYPNGGWPQGYDRFPDPTQFPVKAATFPETWPRQWPGSGQYWLRYTLNDNALAKTIETLFEAERIYTEASAGQARHELGTRCREAAEKAGDFLLLAQMLEPQPAWAQQYDFEMHPSWARKFEPPAVSGGESQGILRALMMVYRETGKRKYLEPIPRALAYLRASRLPDGQLARFYELRSNKPLYFTKTYELTYKDDDLPTHYSFKVQDQTEALAKEYEQVSAAAPAALKVQSGASKPRLTDSLRTEVKSIITAQDEEGRWVETGKLRYHQPSGERSRIIRCATFIKNVETLARYLEASR